MPLNSPKRPPYWSATFGFNFDHITAVDMSFRTSLRNFIQIGPPSAEKMTSCRFSRRRISAIFDFRDPIMGSLKSQLIIALNCLVFFRKSRFFAFWRQTDRQTNRDERMDSTDALSHSRCRERRLNNVTVANIFATIFTRYPGQWTTRLLIHPSKCGLKWRCRPSVCPFVW